MAGEKVAGVDVLVKVDDGAGSKIAVGGQSGAELSRSANMIETTSKDDGGFVTRLAGMKDWNVSCEAFMVVDDAGYAQLSNAFTNGTAIEVEMVTGTGAGHLTFTGSALISDFPMTFAQDDAVTFSLTLEGNGALQEDIEASA